MMKQLSTLLLFVISFSSIAQNLRYDDWIEKPARHDYSKMLVWRYNLDKMKIRDTSFIVSGDPEFDDTTLFFVEHYNKDRYVMRTKGYNGYHYSFEITTYEYDRIGRVIEKKDYSRDSSLEKTTQISFNDHSKNMLQKVFIDDKLKEYALVQYSNQESLLSIKRYWGDGRLEWYQFTIWDSDSLKIMKDFEGDSTLDLYLVYQFDDSFQLIESSILESDSSFSQGTYYQYDSQGRISNEKWIVDDGEIREEIMYKYDKDGELLKKITFDSGTLYSVTEYEVGIIKSEKIYDKSGEVTTLFVYEYE